MEKPKGPINFPRNLLQAAAVIDARSGGSKTLPGTLPERESPQEAFFITMVASRVMCE
jgi:hypothetical protein